MSDRDLDIKELRRRYLRKDAVPVESDSAVESGESDDLGPFEEVEQLVRDPARERRLRRQLEAQDSLLKARNVPNLASSDSNQSQETEEMKDLHDKFMSFCADLVKPLMFVLFMIFWILKEPIIRSVTFVTIVVSNVIVNPLFFVWTFLSNHTPAVESKNKITKWCTGIVIAASVLFLIQTSGAMTDLNFTSSSDYYSPQYYKIIKRLNAIEQELKQHGIAISSISGYTKQQEAILASLKSQHETVWDTLIKYKKEQSESSDQQKRQQQEIKKLVATYQSSVAAEIERFSEQIDQWSFDKVKSYLEGSDVIADFALKTRGGRIMHSRTSRTFKSRLAYDRLRRAVGLYVQEYPPEKITMPSNQVGECWRMEGKYGQVRILLSEPIHVTGITIKHPHKEVLLDEINAAPKTMQILGYKNLRDDHYEHIAKVEYNPYEQGSSQKFDFDPSGVVEAVDLQILDNWGNNLYTEVYQVQVHGTPASL